MQEGVRKWKEELLVYCLNCLNNVSTDVLSIAIRAIHEGSYTSELQSMFTEWQIMSQLEYIIHNKQDIVVGNTLKNIESQTSTSYDGVVRATKERSQFHPKTALKIFTELIRINPLCYEALIYLSNACLDGGFNIEAVKILEKGRTIIERTIEILAPPQGTTLADQNLLYLAPIYQKLHCMKHLFMGKILASRAQCGHSRLSSDRRSSKRPALLQGHRIRPYKRSSTFLFVL
ncbi:hypothetical protein AKO1_011896 [Acrasis kona]|uniref:Uncharacterized protein n=1 Tax=Acrasis kona TaxID=1008807 RepID=A0AAW2Z9V7_9EUKA